MRCASFVVMCSCTPNSNVCMGLQYTLSLFVTERLMCACSLVIQSNLMQLKTTQGMFSIVEQLFDKQNIHIQPVVFNLCM